MCAIRQELEICANNLFVDNSYYNNEAWVETNCAVYEWSISQGPQLSGFWIL